METDRNDTYLPKTGPAAPLRPGVPDHREGQGDAYTYMYIYIYIYTCIYCLQPHPLLHRPPGAREAHRDQRRGENDRHNVSNPVTIAYRETSQITITNKHNTTN